MVFVRPLALRLFVAWLVFALPASVRPESLPVASFDAVAVAPAKTSIYVGSVTLTTTTFKRGADARYNADYKARVIPYFFQNEAGSLWIEFSDEQLAALARGERVHFKGHAKNEDGEERRIEGHATPETPGANTGKIKVRVFVSKKIELIFNTTYRFGG
jgi:hypothetical protein